MRYAYDLSMTQVVSLSKKPYEVLKDLKKPNESFSDVVMRITERKQRQSLLRFAGVLKDSDLEVIYYSQIKKDRELSTSREI
jgi:predicted CopG family antitoxin